MSIVADDYFVHPLAVCESDRVGSGTRIWAFVHVLKGAVIGAHCNLGEGVFVESNVSIGNRCTIKNGVALWDFVTLEDGVFVGPSAVFTNDLRPRAFIRRPSRTFLPTVIKRGATIGANATIVCGVTIGKYAFIGAGAVVTRDVPDHALVVGNPGRIAGKVCYCGSKLDSSEYCAECRCALSANSEAQAIKLHQDDPQAAMEAISG
jgi:UDP-2-acetamido-3-amino-2,3-dideoxy-glucuronate N-acetyltransferase